MKLRGGNGDNCTTTTILFKKEEKIKSFKMLKKKEKRNQVEWKSDKYRIKETTSIQTGRKGADMERAGPSPTCGG